MMLIVTQTGHFRSLTRKYGLQDLTPKDREDEDAEEKGEDRQEEKTQGQRRSGEAASSSFAAWGSR